MLAKVIILLTAVWMMSCGNTPDVQVAKEREMSGASGSINSTSSFSDVTGKEWKLIGVYVNGKNTGFNRKTLPEEPGNLFTLNFNGEIVSGTGAPNRYSAPYTTGENRTVSIMLMRSTMMASFFQPENITEHEFFTYMQNVHAWKPVDNNMELYSKAENGSEVRLVFSL